MSELPVVAVVIVLGAFILLIQSVHSLVVGNLFEENGNLYVPWQERVHVCERSCSKNRSCSGCTITRWLPW